MNLAPTSYLRKMRGGQPTAPAASLRDALASGGGGLLAIGLVSYLTIATGAPWLMAPFGASCVLAFAAHKSPLAQPRAIVGGHLISTAVGLLVLTLCGTGWWAMGLAVGLAIAAMMLTRTVHPPAGADPLVVILGKVSWMYLLHPVLVGAAVIVLVALLWNNLFADRQYPHYW